MDKPLIAFDVSDGVAELGLDRPEARNALSSRLIHELDSLVEAVQQRRDVRALLLYGHGKHFAAGADVREMLGLTADAARRTGYVGCSRRLAACAIPVVCAVEGYALGGGCELVEMSDIVVAADDAVFGHPEVTLGTMSGAGGIQRLVRAVGAAAALDMLLTGRRLTAHEALAAGLVSRVCPPGSARETARALARQIAALPTEAARRIKQAAIAAHELPLSAGLALEARLFHETLDTADRIEGMQAFLDKRAPVFGRHANDG